MSVEESLKGKIHSYRDLVVWQRAMQLVEDVYAVTRTFPKDELYGLTSQMRRASISVPSNIAEGQARPGHRELLHFLGISRGSLAELGTQVTLSARLGLLSNEHETQLNDRIAEIGRLLNGLRRALKSSRETGKSSDRFSAH